jgi:methyltransferase (TIGR00027 family)
MAERNNTEQSVSDTAHWIAHFRACESARPDALFTDPYAAKLAGEFARTTPHEVPSWPLVVRTKLIDDLVLQALSDGVDCVLNLAAGLDTRPYRLPLPAALRWIEADLPDMIDYKERALANAPARCNLTREKIDLADASARASFLQRALQGSSRALVITEGLLVYLSPEVVAQLAHDFAQARSIQWWVTDLVSPGILRMMKRTTDSVLAENSRMRFAPASGVAFFAPSGWTPVVIRSLLKEAAKMKRLPSLLLRIASLLPDSKPDRLDNRPWSAVVRFARS